MTEQFTIKYVLHKYMFDIYVYLAYLFLSIDLVHIRVV